jgi:hypothetical protein
VGVQASKIDNSNHPHKPPIVPCLSHVQGFIGLGLSIGKATEKGHADYGTAWGVAGSSSPAGATWDIFVALGSMAFACKPFTARI